MAEYVKDNFENIRNIDELLRDNGIVLDKETPIDYIEVRKDGFYIEINNNYDFEITEFCKGDGWMQLYIHKKKKETK